jgi:hypothetical protein
VNADRLLNAVSRMSHAWYVESIAYEDELIILPIEVIKMIPPEVFYVTRVDKAMAVWSGLDKHHWRQVLL